VKNSNRQLVCVAAGVGFALGVWAQAAPVPAVAVPDTAVVVPTNPPVATKVPVKAKKRTTPPLLNGSSTNTIGGMTITSERMEFDYKEFVIAFDEKVHVVDPQYVMTSDRMLVFLEGTNQIKRIWSIGHVVITQDDRRATCGRAVYERATGQVVMTEEPVVTRGGDRFTGSELVVWMHDQRVVGKDVHVTISPESLKNQDVKP